MSRIFLGKPLHWLLLAVNLAVLAVLGWQRLHTRDFNLFFVILLALAAVSVLVILRGYRKGDRITRDPFEDE
jgi:NADH:ubiquinone oxidoreductase subunit K